jgi:peptidyl-dipeptidase A
MVCHASAWDFFDKDDYRIKMCTKINMNDLIVVHHEMGHIQYFMQYSNLPIMFRMSANPGFHEAIGDTIALSVSIPDHLKAVGLLPDYERDHEQDINYLYKQALHKIAFLPYAYMLELWRWRVFDGTYAEPDDYNRGWWDLRYRMQGVRPPMARNHSSDFDPGAKTHVAEGTPYIRYFVAHIVQFQFYKALCDAAGYQGQLHHCDFYNSKEAGRRLARMLRLGASVPWTEAMRDLTVSLFLYLLYTFDRVETAQQGEFARV